MTTLIIGFITFFVIGSVMWILPSKKERYVMSLRMLARKLGMTVQLCSVDLPDKWDKNTHKESACAYHLYRTKPLKDFAVTKMYPFEVWKHEPVASGWYASRSVALDTSDQNIIEKYVDLIKAIEISGHGVSLFWNEKGDEQAVEDFSKLLSSLISLR